MKKLIIVDISSFIFRAFYAIRPLTSPQGIPVNAVYGVYTMVSKLILDYKPTHFVVAGDRKEKTFRHDVYQEYKANRSSPPEELIPQFDLIENLLLKMGIKKISQVGYEADDIIGSLVTNFKKDFEKIFIATGDKDLMQFVGENVFVLDTKLDKVYRIEDVKEKMGVYPNQIVDYLSMVGDSSDNIPGMKGIGAKGAAKLLEEYDTLENVLKNKDKLTNKRLKDAFDNYYEMGLLSKKLVEIVTNLEMDFDLNDLEFSFYPSDELKEFLDDLGFKSQTKKIDDLRKDLIQKKPKESEEDNDVNLDFVSESKEKIQENLNYNLVEVKNEDELKLICESAKGTDLFYSLEVGDFCELNFCFQDNSTIYAIKGENLVKKVIANVCQKNSWNMIGHNLKKDFVLFLKWGVELNLNYFDISLAHYLIDVTNKHDLETLSEIFTGKKFTNIADKVFLINEIYPQIKEQLNSKGLNDVYNNIDNPLIPILAKMEKNGILLDPELLKGIGEKLTLEMSSIEKELEKINEGEINLRSPKQVAEFLFGKLNFPVIEKTKTMQSTNVEVLEELDARNLGPVPKLLLRYREIDKLFSTYVNVLPEVMDQNTRRVHTSFHQDVTATGRLSSDRPNLQNIPIRSEEGRMIRKAFKASEGHIFIAADYSQVELRILAHFSEDPIMVQAFKNDLDIHSQTASEVLEKDISLVNSEDRNLAKTVNFGLMYGQSSFGLARTLRISRGDAKKFIDSYFHKFSKVKGFLDGLKEFCAKTGYAETLYGRKRFIPDIHSKNHNVRANAERMAINTPIQGTAADIIKVAMINIERELKEKGLKSQMLLQVHDELIFEVPLNEKDIMQNIIRNGMENAIKLRVPFKVDMKMGESWYQLK